MMHVEKMREEIINIHAELMKDRDRLWQIRETLASLTAQLFDEVTHLDLRLMKLEKFIEENELGLDEDNEVIAFKKGVSV